MTHPIARILGLTPTTQAPPAPAPAPAIDPPPPRQAVVPTISQATAKDDETSANGGNAPTECATGTNAVISVFTRANKSEPTGEMTIHEFLKACSDGTHAEAVGKVRAEVERVNALDISDKKRKRLVGEAKLKFLPAVSISGLVTDGGRTKAFDEGRFRHSGFLQIDIDRLEMDGRTPSEVRTLLGKDPHINWSGISPTGGGVKAIMRIPICQTTDEHKAAFGAAETYILEKYGVKIDPSTKDPVRLCYAFDDPDSPSNPDVIPLPVPIPQPALQPLAAPGMRKPRRQTTNDLLRFQIPDEEATEETEAITARLEMKNKLIPLLLKGEWEGHGFPSQSEAVFSLASSICEETANHAQQAVIFRNSGIYQNDRKMKLALAAARKNVTQQKAEKVDCFENLDDEGGSPDPPFPLQCLPPVAEKMAREMARVTTARNEPLAAAAILGALSASIGAGLEVPTGGGRTVRGNLFLLAIADSGTGKGENFTHAAAPFFTAEGEAVQVWETTVKPCVAAELSVTEKRAKRLCELAAKASDELGEEEAMNQYKIATARAAELARRLESSPLYRVADVTKEALAVAMQGQPGEAVASMSSEARGIFSIVKGRYGKEGGDEDFYCSGYSGDTLTVDRIGRPRVTLRRPCLSILWMVQPDAARKFLADDSLMESGMIPRFLMFDPKAEPEERFGHHAPIPETDRAAWGNLITELLRCYRNNGNDPAAVKVSAEAAAALDEFERETVRRRKRTGDLADVAAFVSRWAENAWRLALVLHAASHGAEAQGNPLESGTARDAIEIIRWFADRQLEILFTVRREKRRKDLLALLALLANGRGEITFRELRRSHSLEDKKIRDLHTFFPHAFNIEKLVNGGRPSWVVTAARPLEDKEKAPLPKNEKVLSPLPKVPKLPKGGQ